MNGYNVAREIVLIRLLIGSGNATAVIKVLCRSEIIIGMIAN